MVIIVTGRVRSVGIVLGEAVSLTRDRLSDFSAAKPHLNAVEASETIDELVPCASLTRMHLPDSTIALTEWWADRPDTLAWIGAPLLSSS